MKWNLRLITRARKDNLMHNSLLGRQRLWKRYSDPRARLNSQEFGLLPLACQSRNLDDNSLIRPVWHDGFRAFPGDADVEIPGEWSDRLKVVRVSGMIEKFEDPNVMRF